MRARHTPHIIPHFPIYSSAFLDADQVVLGGGGGSSKSGIKNKLKYYKIDEQRNISFLHELELQVGEDAPMSMAADIPSSSLVCGVNSTEDLLVKGQNENCRVYRVKNNELALVQTVGTLTSGDIEDYQKVTALSPDGTMLVVAGSNKLNVLSYPSLRPLASPLETEKEIYDASFSKTTLVVATTSNLLVYALPTTKEEQKQGSPSSKKKKKPKTKPPVLLSELELLRSIDIPTSIGPTGCTFRCARFNPSNDQVLYSCINSAPVRSRKSKTASRKAFICKWDTTSWTVSLVRKVGDKGLTSFTISPDGNLLAFGNSDLMVGLLDAWTLNPVLTILRAHDFPTTTMAFSPTSRLLVSGSADSLRVITVPDSLGGWSWTFILFVILAVLAIVLAIATQSYRGNLLLG